MTRPGCYICDDARPLVEKVAANMGAIVEEIDINESETMIALYGLRIPVLLGPLGEVIAEGVIDDRRALKREISNSMNLQPE